MELKIKDHIKGVATFEYYRDKSLYYKTETGLIFPVPIEDVENATFLREDKAILFMRYIRKFLEMRQKESKISLLERKVWVRYFSQFVGP